MKILYDHQAFTGARYGGVSRYFYNLMQGLLGVQDVEFELALKFTNSFYFKENPFGNTCAFSYFLGRNITNKLMSQVNRLNSRIILSRKNFDLFHPTYYHAYFLECLDRRPFVVTCFDAIPDKFGKKYFRLDGFDMFHKKLLFQKAARVIAISENTKKDLVETYGVLEDKVDVIYLETRFSGYKPPADFDVSLPARYLLYVGNRENYKNFNGLIKGIAPLLKKQRDLRLVCAGSASFNRQEQALFDSAEVTGQVIYHAIENDKVLYRLYQKAVAFVYPSLYEGFGIPILEAFACGCPIALSHASSFPEVAQDAALYFDPHSADDIQRQIERLLQEPSLRLKLIEQGYERLKHFSSEKMTSQTVSVYHKALGE